MISPRLLTRRLSPSLSPSHRRLLSTPPPTPKPPRRTPLLIGSLATTLAATYLLYDRLNTPTVPTHLNPDYFTPYTLVSSEPISTSPSHTALLTLVPRTPPPADVLAAPEIQSIEIKEPSLQIARHYTPLPPAAGAPGTLRLYIKREPAGEMSRYLFSLSPGTDSVWVRGPHTEYCLPSHHAAATGVRLLFIAGGTGIAPALQAAQKLLGADEKAVMQIVWGVRHVSETGGQLGRECERLKDAFGERLEVRVCPDAQGGIGKGRVKEAVEGWGAERVVVSGSEGFVEFWAGRKEWVGGRETQGRVGGVLGPLVEGQRKVRVWKL
ncbi:hypothetical protein EDC01DRAFT_702846 [Geopyxis carbonaria]|nr:hypothetical protein EDC01DRAFT_702846 [Geopyxis carbonaria]